VEFYGRFGGNVPSAEEVFEHVLQWIDGRSAQAVQEVLSHA
jgi:hypothetical protein